MEEQDNHMVATTAHDPYAALRSPDFRRLVSGAFLTSLGSEMVSIAVGWELYERTHSAFALGLVGLAQVLPVLALSLHAGHAADRFDRKRIVLTTQLLLALGVLGLALLSYTHGALALVYACLALIGAARAYNGPASSTLVTQTVPPESFANAATWRSSSWQLASVLGPALGGFVIAVRGSATLVYLFDALAALIYVVLLFGIHGQPVGRGSEGTTVEALKEGIVFVWRTQIVLAMITLDLFAVLLGGATTLLPVYAKDILRVGPAGLGWLRAAPSVGAVVVALALAYLPPFRRAGRTLLWVVAGFGAATIIFGLSRSFALSLAMLALLGAFDGVSVVIRTAAVLLRTPNAMLGRVSALNSLFIGLSNELGGFESGVAAAFFGPIIPVVGGGIGTILVVILAALIWPEVRRLGRLDPASQ